AAGTGDVDQSGDERPAGERLRGGDHEARGGGTRDDEVGSGRGGLLAHAASRPESASRRRRSPSLRFTPPDHTVRTTASSTRARPTQRAGAHSSSRGSRQKVIAMVWTI